MKFQNAVQFVPWLTFNCSNSNIFDVSFWALPHKAEEKLHEAGMQNAVYVDESISNVIEHPVIYSYAEQGVENN